MDCVSGLLAQPRGLAGAALTSGSVGRRRPVSRVAATVLHVGRNESLFAGRIRQGKRDKKQFFAMERWARPA